MQSIVDIGPPPPPAASFNLAAYILDPKNKSPEKIALAILGLAGAQRISYGTLEQRVRRMAGGFAALGLSPGARVLLRLGNTPDFPIAYLAAAGAGLVPVPTSAQLTVPEISRIAADLDPALIIFAPGIALPETPSCPLCTVVEIDGPETEFRPGDPDRPGYIVYTSGTSGRPRGVIHAHRAVWARRMMTKGWYGLTPEDRLLHAGAFNWTFTLGTGLLDPWAMGATALIPEENTDARALPLLLKRHDASIFAAAPGVYRKILRQPFPPLPKLRHGLAAGEQLSPALRDTWQATTGTPVYEAFGMSECSTFLSASPTRPAPDGATGYAQPGRRIAILNDHGVPVDTGTPGTLAIGAGDPGLMLGYLNAPAETAARFTADGAWFLTGDSARMAEDGAVTYLGRGDDMINAGGIRVSPIEIETEMATHPALQDTAAVEVPIKPGTTVIALFYTADHPVPEADLAAFASARLARYKCPRLYIRRPTLPRGANNKLSRRALREGWEMPDDQT
ncbi:MAG: class I adenylate-forming enzyme family protein [Qingshengfaniella sp.]